MSATQLLAGETPGRFRVTGSLTFEMVPELATEPLPDWGNQSRCYLDLSAVEHADSAGLALLVDWVARARDAGCELVFEQAPRQLVAIARVSGVDSLLGLDGAEAGAEGPGTPTE